MTHFKSKYLYPLATLRLAGLLALIASFGLFVFIGIPSLSKQHSGAKFFGLVSFGFLLFSYIIYVFGKPALTERYNLIIENGVPKLIDNFLRNEILLKENFKGFSFSSYGNKRGLYDFKTLIFYFQDGSIIELPQFLYSNFKLIKPALITNSIKYLGEEPYKWKNLISRHYRFE